MKSVPRKSKLQSPEAIIVYIVLGVISVLVWANYSKVDETVHAKGRVVATAGTQVIQPSDAGIIDKVLVKEGQLVEKGELLVRLQQVRAQAAFADSRAKVAALTATLTRLNAEVLLRPLVFPPLLNEYPEFIQNQTDLFVRRKQAYSEALSALERSLKIVRNELATVAPLLSSGDIGKADVLRLQRQEADIAGAIVNLRNKYFQDALTEMTKAEEDLSSRQQELADRSELLEHTELVAPMAGAVRNINIATEGASVRPGDVVMQLVPRDSALEFEAKLRPADVAFVKEGAPASVKLDAYDYSIYGVLLGHVSFISPDALAEETREGEVMYYRIRITIPPTDKINTVVLQPGITGSVDIRTGNRSVLSFLTKPITKTMSESLRER